jgi:hypothetical protein
LLQSHPYSSSFDLPGNLNLPLFRLQSERESSSASQIHSTLPHPHVTLVRTLFPVSLDLDTQPTLPCRRTMQRVPRIRAVQHRQLPERAVVVDCLHAVEIVAVPFTYPSVIVSKSHAIQQTHTFPPKPPLLNWGSGNTHKAQPTLQTSRCNAQHCLCSSPTA